MHYDIRLQCLITGLLEATEDIGYPTREAAQYTLDMLDSHAERTGSPRYIIIECCHPGSHECHDVDVAYFIHHREHMGDATMTFERWVGEPTDDLIRHI